MDRSLGHLLEIGMAFMLFVFGLSTFLGMQGDLMNFQQEGRVAARHHEDVVISEVQQTVTYLSKEGLYFVLTEDSHLGKGNWLGESGYTSDAGGVEVYVDGLAYPVVTDYAGKRSLKLALQTLTATEFEVSYVVDASGKLTEIRYTSR